MSRSSVLIADLIMAKVVKQAVKALPQVDILINNLGSYEPKSRLHRGIKAREILYGRYMAFSEFNPLRKEASLCISIP